MAAAAEQAGSWQIATACDISLGTYFRHASGHYVDIDPGAISETLGILNADSRGYLLFVATHDEHAEFESEKVTGTSCCAKGSNDVEVHVAVGGGKHGMADYIEYLQSTDREDSHEVIMPPPGMLLQRSEENIHKTSTHELQHTVDFVDPKIQRIEAWANAWMEFKNGTMQVTFSNALAFLGGLAAEKISGSIVPTIVTGVGGFTGGLAGAIIVGSKARKKFQQRTSPTEKRAYATADRLSDFPSVITFQEADFKLDKMRT